jgi:formate dehydrogenase subunit delta
MTRTGSPQVRLINEIALQFGHQPEDQAAERIAAHIRKFWDPRMRADLTLRARTEAAEFAPLALAAAHLLG